MCIYIYIYIYIRLRRRALQQRVPVDLAARKQREGLEKNIKKHLIKVIIIIIIIIMIIMIIIIITKVMTIMNMIVASTKSRCLGTMYCGSRAATCSRMPDRAADSEPSARAAAAA